MKHGHNWETLANAIRGKLLRNFGREPYTASEQQIYKATCMVIRDILYGIRKEYKEELIKSQQKQVFYLSMEFLPGRSLKNNVFHLGIEEDLRKALTAFGKDFDNLVEMEPDAGLGNGGLGRLASCYLDALSSQGMPGHGMSICYEYGIFKQKLVDGLQKELPDDWLSMGDVWLHTKEEEAKEVHFGGHLEEIWDDQNRMKVKHTGYRTVIAIPRDMLISGYESRVVNTLRLWMATSAVSIDMDLFAQGQYLKAMEERHLAEVISKILYPEDAHTEGKILRLTQQYFFISASLQTIVEKHMAFYGTLTNFHEKVAIHINDTHPAMAIPELMRILIDEYNYEWDDAWKIVNETISYTNHTVMPEALEKWPEDLFSSLLPRLHAIIAEINRRHNANLLKHFPDEEALRKEMSIIDGGELRMANLCVVSSHTVNGVSELHSSIIRNDIFGGFSRIMPDKFTNVTNGIAYRRWLCQANPLLTDMILELCGPGFLNDAGQLEKLLKYTEDKTVFQRMAHIKKKNKERLITYIEDHNDVTVNPESIFDVQVKRLHEYKRQLLNIFHIMYLYCRIRDDESIDIPPRTFIFGAKAAAGYYMAKEIIRLAYHLSEVLRKDPKVRDRLQIVFLENYSVSLSEIIMPAAEVSEQISLAGKEASGTGNMKLMINGAITIGTEDGANVEIHRAVGDDNIFIFGMTSQEVEEIQTQKSYVPWSLIHSDREIECVIQLLSEGINGENFSSILNYLTTGYNGIADPYFVLKDFASYKEAQHNLGIAYGDFDRWHRMSLINIAKAGIFSADRAVNEYAERIWKLKR
ncbi:MAG: glycogen/starch/alpha-glucan phosphorylase [Anaerovoracaceae bacterium]|jgi:starch phosphorylase